MSRPRPAALLVLAVALAGSLPVAQGAGAGLLGGHRLITSAEERQALDQRRRQSAAPVPVAPTRPSASVVPPRKLELRGFVQRPDGEAVIWVNGRPVAAGDSDDEGLSVELDSAPPGQVRLGLPNGAATTLAPGQTFDPRSGRSLGPSLRPGRGGEP